jgi:nitrous oxide reductase accessory protein NosL
MVTCTKRSESHRRFNNRHRWSDSSDGLSLRPPIGFFMSMSLALLGLFAVSAGARPSEIANVFPYFPGNSPKIITGEGFDPTTTEVWTWAPKSDEAEIKDALRDIERELPPLPAKPPEGAKRTNSLDVESQIIVARLDGSVLWTRTTEGFSKPLLFNIAKPFWVSESEATPGALVYVFGFGLRPKYAHVTVALQGQQKTIFARSIVEPRSQRTTDERLVYFEIPPDIQLGQYSVYVHNSNGGVWGWQKAGDLDIVAAPQPERVFDVRRFGAQGDGLANDRTAICEAVKSAREAGGGIVFFPPGTYLTDETIFVPSDVTLRGANRESCILQGFGDPSHASRQVWNLPTSPPTAIVRLHDRTGIESLTIQGATWKGQGGYALIDAVPQEIEFPSGGHVHNVTLVDCCLRANDEDPRSRRPLYKAAFYAGPVSHRIKLLSS